MLWGREWEQRGDRGAPIISRLAWAEYTKYMRMCEFIQPYVVLLPGTFFSPQWSHCRVLASAPQICLCFGTDNSQRESSLCVVTLCSTKYILIFLLHWERALMNSLKKKWSSMISNRRLEEPGLNCLFSVRESGSELRPVADRPTSWQEIGETNLLRPYRHIVDF